VEQPEFVAYVLDALEELHAEYLVVGSFASIAYGEPRYTNDIDVVIRLDASMVDALCEKFPNPDWYVNAQTVRDAVARRKMFNVIHTLSANKVDFMIAKDSEWSTLQFNRRQLVGFLDDRAGYAAHPEDIILGKLQFYKQGQSEKHLRDIAGMLAVSGELIDVDRVTEWAEKLKVAAEWKLILDSQSNDPG